MKISSYKKILKLGAAALIITLGYIFGRLETGNEFIARIIDTYGYTGVFFMSTISGLNLIVPVPFIVFLPLLLGTGLSYIPTILIIALGLTFGDIIGFLIGSWGREIIPLKNNKTVLRLERVKEKYYWAPLGILFLYSSFVPFSNEVLVVPLGFLRYTMAHIFLVTLIGNIVFGFLSGSTVVGIYSFF